MKVQHVYVHNVLGVRDVEFNLEGRHLFLIGGDNGNGKSSAIRALQMALSGKSGTDWPERPLRDGEDEGEVTVRLDGDDDLHESDHLRVVLRFTRRPNGTIKEELDVYDSAGDRAGSPITLLHDLYKLRAFDPSEFLKLSPAKQRELLCQAVGVDIDPIRAERAKLYEERKLINRQAKEARSAANTMPHYAEAPAEPVDVASLSAELEQINEANNRRNDLAASAGKLAADLKDASADVERLKAELAKAEQLVESRTKLLAEAETALASHGEKLDANEVRERIKLSSEINSMVQSNRDRQSKIRHARDLEQKAEKLTREMSALDKKERETLQSAKWPLPGMSVSDSGVTIEGIPMSQASEAEGLIVSALMGMEMRPKLQLMVLRNGAAFGRPALNSLEDLAKNKGFQLIIETVTRSESDEDLCHLIMEDGREKFRGQNYPKDEIE